MMIAKLELKVTNVECRNGGKSIFENVNLECTPEYCHGDQCEPECDQIAREDILSSLPLLC